MPEQPDLRQRIDATIRPRMLIGLQDAELYDEPGRERIGEWADSITSWVLTVVEPELAARDADTARLREAHAAMALQAGHYERRWESTVVEAQRQAKRADELEQQAELNAWRTMRLGEEIARLRKKLAAALPSTDDCLRSNAEANHTIAASLRAKADAVLALHRPVPRGAMTICDACSPRRGDGPTRYVLVDYPCPTANALTAASLPTT